MNQLLKDILNRNADFDRALQKAAGEGNDLTNCHFCDCVVHIDDLADVSKDLLPRCVACNDEFEAHHSS